MNQTYGRYLINMKQYVEIDDSKSDMLNLTPGVPQGSILGPLLFIIYMNDIAHSSKMFDFIIYADDTTLSTTIEIVVRTTTDLTISNVLNNELSLVNNWLKVNKLTLNIKKKQIYDFSYKNEKGSKFNIKN